MAWGLNNCYGELACKSLCCFRFQSWELLLVLSRICVCGILMMNIFKFCNNDVCHP